MVSSKAKVAPLKMQTLPKLELEAAKIGVQLADYIMEALGTAIQLHTFYWSDSMVALGWIKGEPHRWKTFVANRVQLIHLKSSPDDWHHVAGTENPADLCSRGCPAENLISSQPWWNGPAWLILDQSVWPGEKEELFHLDKDALMKEAKCLFVGEERRPAPVMQLNRFSIWSRAYRAMAYAKRYAARPHHPRTGPLAANEIIGAKMEIVRAVQKEAFPNEFRILKAGNLRLQESSKLQGLRPYYDEVDRVIRLRRRTRLSEEEAVDLIVLPSKHWLLNLLIWDAHRRVKHAGVSQTITEIRQSYWILRGRQAVRDLLSRCVPCRKLYGRCLNQPIAPLPSKRCSRSLAFETVGIDFAGPLFIKQTDRTASKAYICLITCATTRAVHLELVCSLTTDDFLLAFRRFIAQRGLCRIVYSDNAKTFQKAETVLIQLWENMESA